MSYGQNSPSSWIPTAGGGWRSAANTGYVSPRQRFDAAWKPQQAEATRLHQSILGMYGAGAETNPGAPDPSDPKPPGVDWQAKREDLGNLSDALREQARNRVMESGAARGLMSGEGSGPVTSMLTDMESDIAGRRLSAENDLSAMQEQSEMDRERLKMQRASALSNYLLGTSSMSSGGGAGGGVGGGGNSGGAASPVAATGTAGGWGPYGYNNPRGAMAAGGYYPGSPGYKAKYGG